MSGEEIVSDSDNNLASPRASHPERVWWAGQISTCARGVAGNRSLPDCRVAIQHEGPQNFSFKAVLGGAEADEGWEPLGCCDEMRDLGAGRGDDSVTTDNSPSFGLQQMTSVYVPVLLTFRKSCLSSLDLTFQNGNRRGAVSEAVCSVPRDTL